MAAKPVRSPAHTGGLVLNSFLFNNFFCCPIGALNTVMTLKSTLASNQIRLMYALNFDNEFLEKEL